MAQVFAETAETYSLKDPEKIWSLCLTFVAVSPEEAPVNSPREFIPFCGARGMGAVGSASPMFSRKALFYLRELADDPRWRLREGVAMGIQNLLSGRGRDTLKELEDWIGEDNWLAMRAVAAAVAEPAVLKDEQTAGAALKLHRKIFARVLAARDRNSGEFKTLRQGLGYSLSVVINALPREGFEYLRQLAGSRDEDVRWIIRKNLKKKRLTKNFPDEVGAITRLME